MFALSLVGRSATEEGEEWRGGGAAVCSCSSLIQGFSTTVSREKVLQLDLTDQKKILHSNVLDGDGEPSLFPGHQLCVHLPRFPQVSHRVTG